MLIYLHCIWSDLISFWLSFFSFIQWNSCCNLIVSIIEILGDEDAIGASVLVSTLFSLALPDRFFRLSLWWHFPPPQRQTEKSGLTTRDYILLEIPTLIDSSDIQSSFSELVAFCEVFSPRSCSGSRVLIMTSDPDRSNYACLTVGCLLILLKIFTAQFEHFNRSVLGR